MDGGLLVLALFALNIIIGFVVIVFAIRLWGLITEADEFFARENQRYRQEYERRRHSGLEA